MILYLLFFKVLCNCFKNPNRLTASTDLFFFSQCQLMHLVHSRKSSLATEALCVNWEEGEDENFLGVTEHKHCRKAG